MLQVRKNTFYAEVSGNKWLVVGKLERYGWSVRIACATKREAYYRKARVLAGLDAFADGGETRIENGYMDADGVWTA